MYDCQRRFLYLIIIIYLIIYISARVIPYRHKSDIYRRKSDIYKRKKGRRHLHRRHNESPVRQGCGQTGGSLGAEGRGAVRGEYCKKQGGCVGFSDFMFTFARCRGGSGSCQRHLQERGGTDGGGQTTLQAAGTMHQATGTMHQAAGNMHQAAGTMHQVAGTMHHGRWDYAPWRPGLCARSPGARTKDKRHI